VLHAIDRAECRGAINVVAPEPATNAEFVATLAATLGRPAAFPVPAWLLHAIFGEMATETVLASTRAGPVRLIETGYAFRTASLAGALRAILAG
jgi:hypothetical protein